MRDKQGMWDCFTKERRTEKASSCGKMDRIMKVILLMGSFQVMAYIILQTYKRHIRVNLGHLIWKEEERRFGLMGENMKETLKMGKRMEKEYLNGLMGKDI